MTRLTSCSASVTIINAKGLHARAAAQVARLAAEHPEARVAFHYGGETALAASILGLLALGAACDATVEIEVQSTAPKPVLAAFVALIDAGFGEGRKVQPA